MRRSARVPTRFVIDTQCHVAERPAQRGARFGEACRPGRVMIDDPDHPPAGGIDVRTHRAIVRAPAAAAGPVEHRTAQRTVEPAER
ncbi:hypothetical protein AB0F72_17450 [Actinoplanes sp. NPDC023936]|uniref:hypothetical protein n=1 Tax=Actinoplanes sp. NPDC023936 TaxID=3154910 RepID=UPI003402798A